MNVKIILMRINYYGCHQFPLRLTVAVARYAGIRLVKGKINKKFHNIIK